MKLYFLTGILLLLLVGCSNSEKGSFSALPAGDANNGEILYTDMINGAPACSTCHALDDTALTGPSFNGYSAIAATRNEGQSAEEYTYNAIVRPADYLVDGYANLMYSEYQTRLSDQNLADLIAYLLTQ